MDLSLRRRKLEEAEEILHNEVNYLYIFLRSYSELFYLFIAGAEGYCCTLTF
jgi:hypothetical protein